MKFSIILLSIILLACKQQEFPDVSLTVEAYLFEGKAVDHINLALVKPINSIETQQPVTQAEVYIYWNKIFYHLTASESIPGNYYYQKEDLKIISGNIYELYIRYNNKIYTSLTTVPILPLNLVASKDTLNSSIETDTIKMTWNNQNSTWYLGVITQEKNIDTKLPFNNSFSIPTRDNKLKIAINNVHSTGTQQFILYGITSNFAKLFRNPNSSKGYANGGNLSRGFGIFAAFSTDTLYFEVKDN